MSLIKEFAIDPKVMATWEFFDSYWEDFGAEKGRLISNYPVLWKNKVDELARMLSKPVRASAISAKLRRDAHKFLLTDRNYNGTECWLNNALSQMRTRRFHTVIACENPSGSEDVLIAGELAKDEPPYKVVTEDFVPRTASSLAQSAALLLRHCEQIQFVDPYFSPSEPRFKNTFQAMLALCSSGALNLLEIHREKPETFIHGVQETNYRRQLADLVPTGLTLKVFFWSQRPGGLGIHPRFLLTDIGGIHFENGLDEGEAGEQTLVKPLTHEVWKKCRSHYCQTSGTFDLLAGSTVEVLGRG